MASDITSVHLALGLLDQHSFKTLEQAVQQFKDHKQRFHESLFELKSLKPSAGTHPDTFSHLSSHGMQTRCTPGKLLTGGGVSSHLRCTPLEPPSDSTFVQEGIENHSYSLRPRASRKLSPSGAPQRITRSRAKQPATTSTGAACNNSRKSGFIVLEDDFVEVRAKGKRKPGQHEQASFQGECTMEAAVSGDAKAFPNGSLEKLGPSSQDVTAKTAHSLPESCERELLTPSSTKRFENAGKETCHSQEVITTQKQPDMCKGELQTPSSLKRFKHLDKETFSFVQQIPISNKGHSVSPCQNTVTCNKDHLPVMHEEGKSARSCSRNYSYDTHAVVIARSPSAWIHLPTSMDQSTKQINDVVQCEVNQEKQPPTDAEDGPCFSCPKEDYAFGLQPSTINMKHSLPSPCQEFNGTETRQFNSHKRKRSVFGSPASGFVPSNDVKRRKRTFGSLNSIEVEAFKFDVDDSFPGREASEYSKFMAASLCKVNRKSSCMQGDCIQARRSAFRELSTPGIKDAIKNREVIIEGGETGLDCWHIKSVALETSGGILSQAHHEGAGRLQVVDFQEGKPASPDSYHVNTQTLHQAHEKIESPNDSSRNTYINCNNESQSEAAEEQKNSVVAECALAEQLLLSNLKCSAVCISAKEQLEQENMCPLQSKSGLPVRTSVEAQPCLHELAEGLSTPGIVNSAKVEELSFARVEIGLECHPNSVTSEKPCGSVVAECLLAEQLLPSNLKSPAVCISTKEQLEQENMCPLQSKSGLLGRTSAEVQPCLHGLAEGLSTPGIVDSAEVEESSFARVETGLECHPNSVTSEKPCGILSLAHYEAAGCGAHAWDDSLQVDIHEGKPALSDPFLVSTRKLHQAHEAIEPSFDSGSDTCVKECKKEFQSEASEKQDSLVLECAYADQLLLSTLNSPAVCFSTKVHPEQEKMGMLQSGLLLATPAEVQPCLHELAEGLHTPGINSSLDIQKGKPVVPDSLQVTPQKLHQAYEMMDTPFKHSRDTEIEECSNESQAEAPEKQDDSVLECEHADLRVSDSKSPAVCFLAKVQLEEEAVASRNTVVMTDDLPNSDGFDSLHRQAMGSHTIVVTDDSPYSDGFNSLHRQAMGSHKSHSKLSGHTVVVTDDSPYSDGFNSLHRQAMGSHKSHSKLSGLRRDCIDTPHMKPARAGLVHRSSPKCRNFEWHLEACLEDGKENQTPEICLKDKVYSSKGLLLERQATPGTRKKILGCSNQSLGGLVDSTHKRYNLAVETRSFLDLVQQKQLPLPYPNGKREVRVKALEAAELARRQEERRENERKMRRLESNEVKGIELENCKDKAMPSCASTIAMKGVTQKVKRVAELKLKMDQEKAKKHEVDQKKKEEERKKKEAEFADKKRKREDADKKDREEKRKRVEEVQKLKKEQEERQRLELEEKEYKRKVLEERERERKAQEEEAKKLRRLQKEREAERRRKQEQHFKASRLAEKQAERKRKEVMMKTRGFEDDAIAQLGLGNKLSLLSTESFAVSSSTDWEVQSKSTIRTRSQTSEDRWGLRVPSLGASAYCQTNNGKLSRSACFAGNGTPFPVNTTIHEGGLKFEPSKGSKSQYTTPLSLRLGAYASVQQTHFESNNQTYEISPYKSSSDDDDDEDDQQKKPIPLWARKENLLPQILWQQCMDPDDIFSTEKTCSLAEIFGTVGSRRCKDFTQRSASGDWLCDYASRKEELDYKKAMGYIQG